MSTTESHPENNDYSTRNNEGALADEQLAASYQEFLAAAKANEEPFALTRMQKRVAAGIGAAVVVWGINALVQNSDHAAPLDPSNKPQPAASTNYHPPYGKGGGPVTTGELDSGRDASID
jgi:hypothetical protein